MRFRLATMVLMALPAVAAAQSRSGDRPALPLLPSIGLPLAPIGLPLAPIGLPLPAIGLPPPGTQANTGVSRAPRGREHGSPRRDSRRHDGRSRPSVVYVVPSYGWPFAGIPQVADSAPETRTESAPSPTVSSTSGIVRFDIDAGGAIQAFADGYYAGTLDELENEIELDAGPHRIELHAAGYEPLAVDVQVTASRSISYRAALTPTAPPADLPAPRSTIYFIPGCYLGNVPPAEVSLPATCDLSQLITRKP